jgi:hypothetical protein
MIQAADSGPSVGQLVAMLLGAIPILGIMAWSAVKILGPIGQALARRIGGGSDRESLEHKFDALAEEVDHLRAQLAETHERLDFTERMLAQGRQPEQLPRS